MAGNGDRDTADILLGNIIPEWQNESLLICNTVKQLPVSHILSGTDHEQEFVDVSPQLQDRLSTLKHPSIQGGEKLAFLQALQIDRSSWPTTDSTDRFKEIEQTLRCCKEEKNACKQEISEQIEHVAEGFDKLQDKMALLIESMETCHEKGISLQALLKNCRDCGDASIYRTVSDPHQYLNERELKISQLNDAIAQKRGMVHVTDSQLDLMERKQHDLERCLVETAKKLDHDRQHFEVQMNESRKVIQHYKKAISLMETLGSIS